MNLVRRDEVLEDLINLAARIAEDDLVAADRFLDSCATSFERLTQTPYIGTERQFKNSALRGIRLWFVQGFPKCLIFYRVLGETVEILRVLHAARDIAGIFHNEEDE